MTGTDALPSPPGRSARTAATRGAIVTACTRLFGKRGFTGTSIDQIARAVGLTKGAIYWHFRNKDALFAAILDGVRAEWDATVLKPASADLPTATRLQRFLAGYAAFSDRSPDGSRFLQRLLLEADDRYAPQVARVFKHTTRVIQNMLEDGRARGDCRQNTDAERMAQLLVAALLGASQHHLVEPGFTIADQLEEVRRMVLGRILA